MAVPTIPLPLQTPQVADSDNDLLRKIALYLVAVIRGDVGFLVRGNLATTARKGATVTRAGITTGLTASQTLVAANASRLYFVIDNRTGVDLFYRYDAADATTAVGGYDVRVPAGAAPVVDDGYVGAITFICTGSPSATGVNVTEVSV